MIVQESKEEEDDPMDAGETVSSEQCAAQVSGSSHTVELGVYTRALSTGLIQKNVEAIVAIVLAGAGAERRKAEANPEGIFFYWFRM